MNEASVTASLTIRQLVDIARTFDPRLEAVIELEQHRVQIRGLFEALRPFGHDPLDRVFDIMREMPLTSRPDEALMREYLALIGSEGQPEAQKAAPVQDAAEPTKPAKQAKGKQPPTPVVEQSKHDIELAKLNPERRKLYDHAVTLLDSIREHLALVQSIPGYDPHKLVTEWERTNLLARTTKRLLPKTRKLDYPTQDGIVNLLVSPPEFPRPLLRPTSIVRYTVANHLLALEADKATKPEPPTDPDPVTAPLPEQAPDSPVDAPQSPAPDTAPIPAPLPPSGPARTLQASLAAPQLQQQQQQAQRHPATRPMPRGHSARCGFIREYAVMALKDRPRCAVNTLAKGLHLGNAEVREVLLTLPELRVEGPHVMLATAAS